LSSGGELGLAVGVQKDGVLESALQLVTAGLELVELLAEAEGLLALAEAVEVVQHGVRLAVDGLSAELVLLGQACDGAVASEEDSGGAGDAIPEG
jgi:hypothetical protein